ncbi:MAG TPA: ATP-binding protein [Bacteroidota bacterium]|nr:ATP-binding protein [Bacteroidota bacterium]
MKPISFRVASYFIIDVTLLLLGLTNILSLSDRARIPFEAETQAKQVVVTGLLDPNSSGELGQGDEILSWNGRLLLNHEALEILGDLHKVGEKVKLDFQRGGKNGTTEITLIQFYSTPRFAIVYAFVGFVVWCSGIIVALSRQKGLAVSTLHWLMISLATTVLMTQGPIEAGTVAAFAKRSILFVSYTLIGALFAYLTIIFPKQKIESHATRVLVVVAPAVILIAALMYYFFRAILSLNPEDFVRFQTVNDTFHAVIAIYAVAGIVSLFHSFRTFESKEDRLRLQWILWGFAVGPAPFVILVALPLVFGRAELVPEEYATIFLLAAPLSLAISVLRYRLFDIETVINRSIVYTTLMIFIGSVYVLVVVLLVSVLGKEKEFTEYAFIVVVTLGIAFAFNPVRTRLQNFIDETLFPARANFRKVVTRISQDLQHALSSDQLFKVLTDSVHDIIPFNAVAVYLHVPGRLSIRESRGEPLGETLALKREHISLFTGARVFATSEAIDFRRHDIDIGKESVLRRFGCAICVPLLSETEELLGVLAARPSSTTGKFDEDEVDLLETICAQAAEVLGRLNLQEKIILEQEERSKIEELNRLKTYFVSGVSHELRTPLTSIKMFTETIRTLKRKDSRKRKEYLDIIEGETERLSRLIENVLDFSKIERGVKEYRFSDINVVEAVQRGVRAMKYQFAVEGARFEVDFAKKLQPMRADADAIEEVVLNLLSNALKYSTGKKKVGLRLYRRNSKIIIEVSDNGIGISPEDTANIFEPFYRARNSRTPQVGGTGLGLALVKHIVDAHHGTISLKSKIGKGSIFTVELPANFDENNPPR